MTHAMNVANVQRSLRLKMILAIVVSLLISLFISSRINASIHEFVDETFEMYVDMFVTLLISTIIISLFVRFLIINPLTKVVQAINKASEGDLTITIDYRSKDEIGQLSNAFNMMVTNLKNLVEKTNEAALQVSSYSEELSISAEQNSKTIEQISIAIQEVAAGSETQSKSALELSTANQQVAQGAERLALSIQSVADISNATDGKADAGIRVVSETVEQMNLVQESVRGTATTINTLGEKSKEIGEIVGMIRQIADQTNLLALNAAIEAARAGEHGKGFAVVADEVRKLAEQSSHASGSIEELIKEIQLDTDTAVHAMNSGMDIVEKGILKVYETGESFKDIIKSVQEISSQVQEVSVIFEQVGRNSNSMRKRIEEIVTITEQAAGSTQQIASSVQEQNASMEEITSSSVVLNKMSQELKEDIHKFKIDYM